MSPSRRGTPPKTKSKPAAKGKKGAASTARSSQPVDLDALAGPPEPTSLLDALRAAGEAEPAPGELSELTLTRQVEALARVMRDYQLSEVLVDGDRLQLRREPALAPSAVTQPAPIAYAAPVAAPPSAEAAPSPATTAAPAPAQAGQAGGAAVYVTSPFVGTFYRAPSPEAPVYAEVGQRVKKGQALCIVEAMKLMNEIESDVDGVVVAVLAENGQPVEFGEPLFQIRP